MALISNILLMLKGMSDGVNIKLLSSIDGSVKFKVFCSLEKLT